MKKRMSMLAAALLLVGVIALAGCGGSGTSTSGTGSDSNTVTEAELGVPIYPGAKQVEAPSMGEGGPGGERDGSRGSAPDGPPGSSDGTQPPEGGEPPRGSAPEGNSPQRGSAPDGQARGSMPEGGRMGGTTFLTADSYEKVVAWYKSELSGKTDFKEQEMKMPGSTQDQSGNEDGGSTMLTFASGEDTKMVMIRRNTGDEGGTYITIGDAPSGGMPGQNPSN